MRNVYLDLNKLDCAFIMRTFSCYEIKVVISLQNLVCDVFFSDKVEKNVDVRVIFRI